MSDKALNPQTTTERSYSTLEVLAANMLRRFGDYSNRRVSGDVMLQCLDYANEVIEIINGHPYWDDAPIAYYTHQSQVREIPDVIIARGLYAKHAEAKMSNKYPNAMRGFFEFLNLALYNKKYPGAPAHQFQVPDREDTETR